MEIRLFFLGEIILQGEFRAALLTENALQHLLGYSVVEPECSEHLFLVSASLSQSALSISFWLALGLVRGVCVEAHLTHCPVASSAYACRPTRLPRTGAYLTLQTPG